MDHDRQDNTPPPDLITVKQTDCISGILCRSLNLNPNIKPCYYLYFNLGAPRISSVIASSSVLSYSGMTPLVDLKEVEGIQWYR